MLEIFTSNRKLFSSFTENECGMVNRFISANHPVENAEISFLNQLSNQNVLKDKTHQTILELKVGTHLVQLNDSKRIELYKNMGLSENNDPLYFIMKNKDLIKDFDIYDIAKNMKIENGKSLVELIDLWKVLNVDEDKINEKLEYKAIKNFCGGLFKSLNAKDLYPYIAILMMIEHEDYDHFFDKYFEMKSKDIQNKFFSGASKNPRNLFNELVRNIDDFKLLFTHVDSEMHGWLIKKLDDQLLRCVFPNKEDSVNLIKPFLSEINAHLLQNEVENAHRDEIGDLKVNNLPF